MEVIPAESWAVAATATRATCEATKRQGGVAGVGAARKDNSTDEENELTNPALPGERRGLGSLWSCDSPRRGSQAKNHYTPSSSTSQPPPAPASPNLKFSMAG